MNYQTYLKDADATVALGSLLASACSDGIVIELQGNLGAGKTTLVRGFLQAQGHTGAVKSPTYTLVEPYHYNNHDIYHFDLYRLGDPEELEYLGIRDYFNEQAQCLIEWPERGEGMLPQPDLVVHLNYDESDSRRAEISSNSERGKTVIETLSQL